MAANRGPTVMAINLIDYRRDKFREEIKLGTKIVYTGGDKEYKGGKEAIIGVVVGIYPYFVECRRDYEDGRYVHFTVGIQDYFSGVGKIVKDDGLYSYDAEPDGSDNEFSELNVSEESD